MCSWARSSNCTPRSRHSCARSASSQEERRTHSRKHDEIATTSMMPDLRPLGVAVAAAIAIVLLRRRYRRQLWLDELVETSRRQSRLPACRRARCFPAPTPEKSPNFPHRHANRRREGVTPRPAAACSRRPGVAPISVASEAASALPAILASHGSPLAAAAPRERPLLPAAVAPLWRSPMHTAAKNANSRLAKSSRASRLSPRLGTAWRPLRVRGRD